MGVLQKIRFRKQFLKWRKTQAAKYLRSRAIEICSKKCLIDCLQRNPFQNIHINQRSINCRILHETLDDKNGTKRLQVCNVVLCKCTNLKLLSFYGTKNIYNRIIVLQIDLLDPQ